MSARRGHLRLVPPAPAPPVIKDIAGEGIPCDCFCGLWAHSKGICWEHATIRVEYSNGAVYDSCKPCYDDMLIKEKDL